MEENINGIAKNKEFARRQKNRGGLTRYNRPIIIKTDDINGIT
jgi:hypothetical protein